MLTVQEKILIVRLLRREKRRLLVTREHRRLIASALAKLEQSIRNIKVNKLDKPTYL